MRRTFISLLVLSVTLVACGGGNEDAPVTEPTPGERPGPTTVTAAPDDTSPGADTTTDMENLDPDAREIVEAAMADLADRTGADSATIELVAFEYVTWNDGSLGCPQPGEMYTQALVDGSRTVLEVGGTTYHYHAGADGEPFLCESPSLGPGAGGSSTAPTG